MCYVDHVFWGKNDTSFISIIVILIRKRISFIYNTFILKSLLKRVVMSCIRLVLYVQAHAKML